MIHLSAHLRGLAAVMVSTALVGCSSVTMPGGYGLVGGEQTAADRQPTADRPEPDARGVISYPDYQIAVARRGDTVADIASRLGLDPANLAQANGLPQGARLTEGQVVILPRRVDAAPANAGTQSGELDVSALANDALDRAEGAPQPGAGQTPTRHTVAPGETAYSIARQYDVSVSALADWNGLDSDYSVREGQTLLIPVATGQAGTQTASVTGPGAGSPTPEPPSAAQPQPQEAIAPAASEGQTETAVLDDPQAAETAAPEEPRPEIAAPTAASDTAQLRQPVAGRIIRGYAPGSNEGLDFGADAGTPVVAAGAGTVAAITQNTDQVPIIVIRHDEDLLTVYANVTDISVERGDTVSRGAQIGAVRAGDPSYLHFEVRNGFESVDPVPYISQ